MGVAAQWFDRGVRSARGTQTSYVLLAAALVIFIASLASTGARLARIDRAIAEGLGENLVWTVVQGEIERVQQAQQLDLALHHRPDEIFP